MTNPHGQHLSRTAKGAINRFYAHADTRNLNAAQELVSDLALAADDKARDRLWKKAADVLKRLGVQPQTSEPILAQRNLTRLAELTASLASRK